MPSTRHAYEHVSSIYFPIAIGVFAALGLILAYLLIAGALRRRPGGRSEAMKVEMPYAALLACVVGFLLFTTYRAEGSIDRPVARPGLRLRVTAAQWSWRFEYPNGVTVTAVSTWRPPLAYVPTGTEVEVLGRSLDVIHGFWIPRLRFMRQLLPEMSTRFDLLFSEPGRYEGVCAVYCGLRHDEMHFAIEAVSPQEFSRWLASGGRHT